MKLIEKLRPHIREIVLGLLFLLSITGIVTLFYKSTSLTYQLSSVSAAKLTKRELFRLLYSAEDVVNLAVAVTLLLTATLCFVLYYFIQRQRRLVRAAAIIRRSQNRYRFFTEAPPSIGIVRFDLIETRIADANRAALLLFGRARSEMVGRTLFSIIPKDERQKMQQAIDELRAGRRSLEVTMKMVDHLDREKYVSWHITSLKNPDAEPEAVAVVLDVTDKIAAENERIEKERLAGVVEMAGATAHELNQPLQVISGIAWMMLSKLQKNDPNYRNAEKIYEEVERMAAIARKISSISSYEVKKYVGETRIIDIDKAATPRGKSRRGIDIGKAK